MNRTDDLYRTENLLARAFGWLTVVVILATILAGVL